jgi:putative ABC transport system permease protein
VLGYVWHDLVRNPRRTLAALVGIVLGVGLFSGVLFFGDGSRATLTERAIAPLALDLQVMVNAPLGRAVRLEEHVEAPRSLRPGDTAQVVLRVVNTSRVPANEVVVDDEPPPPLRYEPGSLRRDGLVVPDVGGRIPLAQGAAGTGLNLGTMAPGATVTLLYRARATSAVPDVSALALGGRFSTREQVVPVRADAPPPPTTAELESRLRSIPGVVAADGLSFVDLPAASLRSARVGGAAAAEVVLREPIRVFAFDGAYQRHYPSIRTVAGGFEPASAVLSAEASRALGARPGAAVSLDVPGATAPLTLPVSGVVDVAQAKPLFYSRKIKKLEDFLYVPNVVVVSPGLFRDRFVPALQSVAAAEGDVVKNQPVSEVDVLIARSRLNADPARALAQTSSVAAAAGQVAPGETYLIDNISNTLQVARDDAAVGRRMFVFLGVPGILLAVFLTGYSGSILAATQRRENAVLRLRGAHRGHLLRLLVGKAVILAGAGSLLGTVVGLGAAATVLGRGALVETPPSDLAASAALALGAGLVATTLALSLPGVRSLRREVGQERREITMNPAPAWRRRGLDVVLLVATAVAEGIGYLTGAFDAPPGSVSLGEAVSLPSRLLVAPLVAWLAGTLLFVRMFQAVTTRLPVPAPPAFGPLLRGTLMRNVRRRSWALAAGTAGVALVVALGVALAVFSAGYDRGKRADSTFTIGSDLRVDPSPLSSLPHPTSSAGRLRVDGVASVTPVVSTPENAVLVASFNQDRRDLAAIDPRSFAATAALRDTDVVGSSAAEVLAELAGRPDGALLDAASAEEFHVAVGDDVKVLLARGTKQQSLRPFHVLGLYERFPGFPLGVNVVVNLATYQAATGLTDADFFLVRAVDGGPRRLARVQEALLAGPGRVDPITVRTTVTALNKDQSSLTALDINGLVRLDTVFITLMSAATIGMFVFALLLHRRREYLTLRALGLSGSRLFGLVLGEGALVVGCGLVAGVPVGIGMGYLFMHVLRPLFILPPVWVVPVGRIAVLAMLPALAALVSALAATVNLRRLRPAEVLRET